MSLLSTQSRASEYDCSDTCNTPWQTKVTEFSARSDNNDTLKAFFSSRLDTCYGRALWSVKIDSILPFRDPTPIPDTVKPNFRGAQKSALYWIVWEARQQNPNQNEFEIIMQNPSCYDYLRVYSQTQTIFTTFFDLVGLIALYVVNTYSKFTLTLKITII